MRILLANEPTVYREAMAEALRELRPQVEVGVVEPEELDHVVGRLGPHLVVCSRVDAVVETVFAWMLIYPDGEDRAEFKAGQYRSSVVSVELGDLIRAADLTEQLLYEICAENGEGTIPNKFASTLGWYERPGAHRRSPRVGPSVRPPF